MVADSSGDTPLTIPALMRRNAAERPGKLLMACDDEHLTYGAADARSRILAGGLIAAGARKGSHVAILMPPGADFIVAMLAAARIGAVVVPLSTMATAEELRALLVNADVGFLLAATAFRSHDYLEKLRQAVPEMDLTAPPPVSSATAPCLRRVWFSGDLPRQAHEGWSLGALEQLAGAVEDAFLDAAEDHVRPADRFVILHSSGSTGQPKGVVHQHGTMLRHLINTNRARDYAEDDVFFTTFAWFWNAGFAFGIVGTLLAGGTIAVTNQTEPARVLDFIERERPTITNGFWRTATPWAADPSFVGRDFSFLRRGNLYPILAPDVRPADPALRHDIYGMSETGGAIALGPDSGDLPESMRGSCGQFLPEIEARIVDPETGEEVARGEQGELWLRGPLMAECYYGKPRSAIYTPDGWYRTGDIGMIDGGGYFYLRGRTGDMIKTSSIDVSPREVEAVLGSLTGNLPCVVFGMADEQRGQMVVAVVVTGADIDEAALREAAGAKLSSYKVPRRIFAIAPRDMPVLGTGKFDLRKLAQMVRERW